MTIKFNDDNDIGGKSWKRVSSSSLLLTLLPCTPWIALLTVLSERLTFNLLSFSCLCHTSFQWIAPLQSSSLLNHQPQHYFSSCFNVLDAWSHGDIAKRAIDTRNRNRSMCPRSSWAITQVMIVFLVFWCFAVCGRFGNWYHWSCYQEEHYPCDVKVKILPGLMLT